MTKLDTRWRCYRLSTLAKRWRTTEAKVRPDLRHAAYVRLDGIKLYPWWAVAGDVRPLLALGQVLCEPGVGHVDDVDAIDAKAVAAFLDVSSGCVARHMARGAIPGSNGRTCSDWLIRWLQDNVK